MAVTKGELPFENGTISSIIYVRITLVLVFDSYGKKKTNYYWSVGYLMNIKHQLPKTINQITVNLT